MGPGAARSVSALFSGRVPGAPPVIPNTAETASSSAAALAGSSPDAAASADRTQPPGSVTAPNGKLTDAAGPLPASSPALASTGSIRPAAPGTARIRSLASSSWSSAAALASATDGPSPLTVPAAGSGRRVSTAGMPVGGPGKVIETPGWAATVMVSAGAKGGWPSRPG